MNSRFMPGRAIVWHSAIGLVALGMGLAVQAQAPANTPGKSVTPQSSSAPASGPKGKATTLGLYVTAAQAHQRWKADPRVKIIDVRTPEEYLFVGYAPMAWRIPVARQTYEWDAAKQQYPVHLLPDFVDRVKTVAQPGDTLLVMCRSGGRSAIAVNLLAQAGYTHVYNIVDGMEGDIVDDTESVFHGQRAKNGWKNARAPWTYKASPERVVVTQGDTARATESTKQGAMK
jgi:rhodanese-related sulfurtransferase